MFIDYHPNLSQARWQKLVWNVGYKFSVVLNATTDELMANIHTRKLVEQLMREVAAGAKSTGRKLKIALFIQMMLDYTVKMKPYRTSMKIDYDGNCPLEVEAIFGNPLRKAQEKGVTALCKYMRYRASRGSGGSRGSRGRNVLD